MLQEFKKFILKGNVLDLAIAVIMGNAFGKIVSSLVENVFTPILGILLGGVDFRGLSYTFGDSVIAYGEFIQNTVDFLIIAFCIFMFLKLINKITQKFKTEEEKAEETKKEQNLTEEYLKEIRDLLMGQKQSEE